MCGIYFSVCVCVWGIIIHPGFSRVTVRLFFCSLSIARVRLPRRVRELLPGGLEPPRKRLGVSPKRAREDLGRRQLTGANFYSCVLCDSFVIATSTEIVTVGVRGKGVMQHGYHSPFAPKNSANMHAITASVVGKAGEMRDAEFFRPSMT